MLLWRIKQFAKIWWHLFASGESTLGKIRKGVGLLIFFGILPYTFWSYILVLYLQSSPISSMEIRVGLLLFIIASTAWALLNIGRAYEKAGVPDLRVSHQLEFDHGVFRLRLLSIQKDLDTTVRVIDVFDSSGKQCLPGRFPLPLDWTHESGNSRVHLTAGFTESVSVQ